MKLSALQKARYKYQPKLPPVLLNDLSKVFVELGAATQSMADQGELKKQFPHTYGLPLASITKGKNKAADKVLTIGVILSGGQAPGGHNVIAGLYDGLKKGNKKSRLLGFLGGPSGLVDGKFIEVTDKLMDQYRNTGGFDMIGSGRTKIETEEQFEKVAEVCKKNDIDGVVVIGGDDSNTNAAVLAEYFQSHSSPVKVIGCPKTIDGDLKTEYIETSFGFDTACKTYSELIGNIGRDANSAKKYWHFIKLMGRSASHIALECALQTQPNVCLVSEEIEAKKQSLNSIVEYIASVVAKRAENKENFGIALIPEGLIEFVPEMKSLIAQLNDHLAHDAENFAKLKSFEDQKAYILPKLGSSEAEAFQSLPADIAAQLLMDRDPHGNVQVSRIETEKLLILMTAKKLEEWKAAGKFSGSFSALGHFFGYEGRCAFPSNFDADYCYSLGYTAFVLFGAGLTGYISSVRHTNKPAKDWICGGIPITQMMNMEQRHGKQKPVIKKALVELEGKPFKAFAAKREEWAEKTSYLYPGAIQYYGPTEVCDQPTKTLELELN